MEKINGSYNGFFEASKEPVLWFLWRNDLAFFLYKGDTRHTPWNENGRTPAGNEKPDDNRVVAYGELVTWG